MNLFFWIFVLCWTAGLIVGSIVRVSVPPWLTDL